MITSKYINEPDSLRLAHLRGAHKVIFEKWWDHTNLRKPSREIEASDIRVSTFEEDLKGEMCLYRHACNGFLGISHEGGEKLLWSISEDEDVQCPGCEMRIPFAMLTFAWMYSKLSKMRPSEAGL